MAAPNTLYCYLAGEFMAYENAHLPIGDLAIQRGYGVFDYFKVRQGQALYLPQYLDRFFNSAAVMGLEVPLGREALKQVIQELLDRNSLDESGVKVLLTGGLSPDVYTPFEPTLMVIQQPLTLPGQKEREQGIAIMSHPFLRDIPQAKSINYAMGIYLLRELQRQGCKDVLYHQNGIVSEFPRSNFFLVRPDDTIVTPAKDMLPGITRSKILSLVQKGYRVEEGEVTLHQIAEASEAFQTSTTKRLLPIVSIDGQPIGSGKPGPVSLALYEELVQLENAAQALAEEPAGARKGS